MRMLTLGCSYMAIFYNDDLELLNQQNTKNNFRPLCIACGGILTHRTKRKMDVICQSFDGYKKLSGPLCNRCGANPTNAFEGVVSAIGNNQKRCNGHERSRTLIEGAPE